MMLFPEHHWKDYPEALKEQYKAFCYPHQRSPRYRKSPQGLRYWPNPLCKHRLPCRHRSHRNRHRSRNRCSQRL
uniref:Uncharacterized protein n=1 Tax=Romanomermis culicivorax TaxID=13658 RepID=A0A915LBS4_ROMCU